MKHLYNKSMAQSDLPYLVGLVETYMYIVYLGVTTFIVQTELLKSKPKSTSNAEFLSGKIIFNQSW